jgi:hypothetical protein
MSRGRPSAKAAARSGASGGPASPSSVRAAAGKAVSAPSCAAARRIESGGAVGGDPRPRPRPSGVPARHTTPDRAPRPQQAVALAHRLFIGQHILGMVGQEAHGHAVEKPPPPVGALDPEPVLRGHQPDDADETRQRHLRGGLAVDPDGAGGIGFGGKLHLVVEAGTGEVARTFQPMASGRRMISSAVARRRPLPGDRSETASIRLVLPAPLGPKSATGRPSRSSRVRRWLRKCDRERWAT